MAKITGIARLWFANGLWCAPVVRKILHQIDERNGSLSTQNYWCVVVIKGHYRESVKRFSGFSRVLRPCFFVDRRAVNDGAGG